MSWPTVLVVLAVAGTILKVISFLNSRDEASQKRVKEIEENQRQKKKVRHEKLKIDERLNDPAERKRVRGKYND